MSRIQLRRGLKANLPTSNNLVGEALVTTDRNTLHVGKDSATTAPLTPAIDDLVTLAAIDGAEDLLIVHDASETAGQKEKKITFSAFKAALNIPEGAEDELVAVAQGATAGYLGGTDGTDGVLRGSASIGLTLNASEGTLTLAVEVVDGGTF
ncbi:MAG: hypothetical protein LBQ81_12305 [Zoogloeaceae bacterium]|jgi:hypothetical protein|nr:hypothetical protein [Zoogloeaceae bacterium]